MTSLDRAKQFLAEKAQKLALVALPLAALAVAPSVAKADPIYAQFGPNTCDVLANGSVSVVPGWSCGGSNEGDQGNGANWLKVWGSPSWTIGASGSGLGSISWWGPASGELDSSLPVAWDFDITASSGVTVSWELYFFIDSTLKGLFSGSGTGNFTGSGVLSGGNMLPTGWSIALNITANSNSAGTFAVSVPFDSIDLNPPGTTDVPEPASVLLFVPGLGYMVWRRRAGKVSS